MNTLQTAKEAVMDNIDHLMDMEGTCGYLDNYFTINMLRVQAFVSKHKIQPARIVPRERDKSRTRKIFTFKSILDVVIETNSAITITRREMNEIKEYKFLESRLHKINVEIKGKEASLRDAEAALTLAEKKLYLVSHKLKQALGDDLLSDYEIHLMAGIRKCVCGVYFLIKGDEIIYVGQSINIHQRIGDHAKSKDFDTFTYAECNKNDLSVMEAKYITKFKPKLNYDKLGRLVLPIRLR